MKAKNIIFNIELLVNGIGDLVHTLYHDTPNTARKAQFFQHLNSPKTTMNMFGHRKGVRILMLRGDMCHQP